MQLLAYSSLAALLAGVSASGEHPGPASAPRTCPPFLKAPVDNGAGAAASLHCFVQVNFTAGGRADYCTTWPSVLNRIPIRNLNFAYGVGQPGAICVLQPDCAACAATVPAKSLCGWCGEYSACVHHYRTNCPPDPGAVINASSCPAAAAQVPPHQAAAAVAAPADATGASGAPPPAAAVRVDCPAEYVACTDSGGGARARSHCRFVLPLIHFIPDLLKYSVPLFSETTMRPNPRRRALRPLRRAVLRVPRPDRPARGPPR
jgi:hypothetical protein